ncbi:MAG: hypothetical protein ACR2PK_03720 [Acidimicrobiales bacterium]
MATICAAVLMVGACSGGSGTPTLESTDEPPASVSPQPLPSPTAASSSETPPTTVPILSASVNDLLDRPVTLTSTVSDLVDAPIITMPDVLALPRAQAEEEVESVGFVPYLTDTFPPTGGPEVVFDTFPFANTDGRVGQTAFVEIDGPTEGVLALRGQRVEGVLNGIQHEPIPGAAAWSITVFLDDPLALETPSGPQVAGREVAAILLAGDITCETGELVSEPHTLARAADASFVIDHDSFDGIRLGPPAQVLALEMIVDCEA